VETWWIKLNILRIARYLLCFSSLRVLIYNKLFYFSLFSLLIGIKTQQFLMILVKSYRGCILELNDLDNPLFCCVLQITITGRYGRTKHARVQRDKEACPWGKKHSRTSVCFFLYISVVIFLNLGGGTHN
jgi:hypothetical protein